LQPPAYSSIPDKKIDKISLRGAALPDPDHPFLISPLPQFTTPLTTSTNFSFTPASVPPLPELTDDLEDEEEEEEGTDSEPEHEVTTPIVVHQDLRGSNGIRRLSFVQTTNGRSEHDSALARTGPYLDHRRARSGSSPETYTSRSSSVKKGTTTTTTSNNASPRSPPKSATLSQSSPQVQQQQHASSSREGDASSPSFPIRSNSTRNPDGGVLRTRLHDLLRDSAMSSSLPNMSASHFPASFTNWETSSGRVSPLPPRSDSSNTNKSSSSSSSSSYDTAVPLLPQTTGSSSGKPLTGTTTFCNFAPRQGFSSASTEAKKLEEERRRKLIEEKQQQQQHANDMMDRESHSSMSNKSSSTSSSSSSTSSTTNQTSNNTSTSIQLTPRREQQPSTATSPIPPSATTRRGQNFTGSLGRSGSSVVSPSKEEQDPGPTFSTSTTRRGQSFSGSLGRSGSIVSPSTGKEEQQQHDTFTTHHQTRLGYASTSSSISKARGGAILSSSVDPAGIYA
jgi:hypothetical protein